MKKVLLKIDDFNSIREWANKVNEYVPNYIVDVNEGKRQYTHLQWGMRVVQNANWFNAVEIGSKTITLRKI